MICGVVWGLLGWHARGMERGRRNIRGRYKRLSLCQTLRMPTPAPTTCREPFTLPHSTLAILISKDSDAKTLHTNQPLKEIITLTLLCQL